jgi:hypothetical protein
MMNEQNRKADLKSLADSQSVVWEGSPFYSNAENLEL